jgi:hypothetical protein
MPRALLVLLLIGCASAITIETANTMDHMEKLITERVISDASAREYEKMLYVFRNFFAILDKFGRPWFDVYVTQCHSFCNHTTGDGAMSTQIGDLSSMTWKRYTNALAIILKRSASVKEILKRCEPMPLNVVVGEPSIMGWCAWIFLRVENAMNDAADTLSDIGRYANQYVHSIAD